MALKGRLEDFKLPDIFKLIQSGKKTGLLHLADEGKEGTILFKKGHIVFAYTGEADVGRKLVESNLISESTLKFAAEKSEDGLGETLVKENFISEKKLKNFLENHTKDTLSDMLSWIEGGFDFRIEDSFLKDEILNSMEIDINDVLDEARQKLADWKKIQKVIPDSQTIVKLSSESIQDKEEVVFSPAEWKIISNVDGRNPIAEIANLTGLDKFSVSKIIYRSIKKGLIDVIPAEQNPGQEPVPEAEAEPEPGIDLDEENVIPIDKKNEVLVQSTVQDEAMAVGDKISEAIAEEIKNKLIHDENTEEFQEVVDEEKNNVSQIKKNFTSRKDIASMSFALEELAMLNRDQTKKKESGVGSQESGIRSQDSEEKTNDDNDNKTETENKPSGTEKDGLKEKQAPTLPKGKDGVPTEDSKGTESVGRKDGVPTEDSRESKSVGKDQPKNEAPKKKKPSPSRQLKKTSPKHAKTAKVKSVAAEAPDKENNSSTLINKFFGNLKKK